MKKVVLGEQIQGRIMRKLLDEQAVILSPSNFGKSKIFVEKLIDDGYISEKVGFNPFCSLNPKVDGFSKMYDLEKFRKSNKSK